VRRAALAAVAFAVAAATVGISASIPNLEIGNALVSDLDAIFNDPLLARALVGVRVDSLATGRTLYARDAGRLVMPASNMKLLTLALAAERLGWNFRYETRLEAGGPIRDGVLDGDLVVVGSGDPSIMSRDFAPAAQFDEWASALREAGIRRVTGRIVGDDRAFGGDPLGAGWAWDYLDADYAAGSGALNYNENVAVIRVWPGDAAGERARVDVTPPGHGFDVENDVQTTAAGSQASVTVSHAIGSPKLVIRGRIAAGGNVIIRATPVENPTRFFVEALRLTRLSRGVSVAGGAWDRDDVADPPKDDGRRVLATRQSQPLSNLAGYFVKVSQNFYAEALLKTVGRVAGGTGAPRPGTVAAARQAARETFSAWGIPNDAYVMNDGSGLSRYDYVTADTMATLLAHVWKDERLRGPFVAALPIAARDGTLSSRMRGTTLDSHVQAKTGTISNVRALSGFLETKTGEKLVFSMIANNFTASSAQIDAIVEKALKRLYEN
jgi:D-alanyl-D-alanine carboxypeptidase/D-alanyl-D-alanine-endopeptidase (penicillin-binding protein 4)